MFAYSTCVVERVNGSGAEENVSVIDSLAKYVGYNCNRSHSNMAPYLDW